MTRAMMMGEDFLAGGASFEMLKGKSGYMTPEFGINSRIRTDGQQEVLDSDSLPIVQVVCVPMMDAGFKEGCKFLHSNHYHHRIPV